MSVIVTRKRGPVRADARNVVRGQATRRRILDMARARILAEGFEELRLDDLASDVGVTKGAVIKSLGGKSAILLALAEEDSRSRLEIIAEASTRRTGLERRVTETVRGMLALDARRLSLVTAFIGYLWFWKGEDRDRSQAIVDETRNRMRQLIADASPTPLSDDRLRIVSTRLIGGYGIGLRMMNAERATLEETVRFVVEYALD